MRCAHFFCLQVELLSISVGEWTDFLFLLQVWNVIFSALYFLVGVKEAPSVPCVGKTYAWKILPGSFNWLYSWKIFPDFCISCYNWLVCFFCSQELLEAVERERSIRFNQSRNATIFHHPTLGDFELQHVCNSSHFPSMSPFLYLDIMYTIYFDQPYNIFI